MRRKLTACCKSGAYLLCDPTEVNPEALNFRPFLRARRPLACPGLPLRRRLPPRPKTAGRQTPRQSPGVRSPHGPFPPPPPPPGGPRPLVAPPAPPPPPVRPGFRGSRGGSRVCEGGPRVLRSEDAPPAAWCYLSGCEASWYPLLNQQFCANQGEVLMATWQPDPSFYPSPRQAAK